MSLTLEETGFTIGNSTIGELIEKGVWAKHLKKGDEVVYSSDPSWEEDIANFYSNKPKVNVKGWLLVFGPK